MHEGEKKGNFLRSKSIVQPTLPIDFFNPNINLIEITFFKFVMLFISSCSLDIFLLNTDFQFVLKKMRLPYKYFLPTYIVVRKMH